jgi:cobalt/nickel transport system permease protein
MSLLAVHISDGVLAWPWLAAGWAILGVMLLVAMWRVREQDVPRIGVLTAAFFVGSSIHFKLAIVPTSVHLILNGLVGVVLGRRAPLAIAVGLTLQCLLLAHGGETAIGINGCIVGIPALMAAIGYPILRRLGLSPFSRGVVLGAGAAAGAVGLNFLVLLLGGKDDWSTLAKLVMLAHVPIVVIEGLMLGVIVRYLEKVKPEMLASNPPPHDGNTSSNGTSH